MLFELTLTNVQARICLKVVLDFWDSEIWVSSTSLKKVTLAGLYRKNSDISKNLDLWSCIQLKGTRIDNLCARNDQNIMSSNPFWWNEAVKVIEAMEIVQGCGGHWGCRGSQAWNITNEFEVIQVLDFSFILMFWTVNFGL